MSLSHRLLKTYHKCSLGGIDDGKFCKLQKRSSFELSRFYLMRRSVRKFNYSARMVCSVTTHILNIVRGFIDWTRTVFE